MEGVTVADNLPNISAREYALAAVCVTLPWVYAIPAINIIFEIVVAGALITLVARDRWLLTILTVALTGTVCMIRFGPEMGLYAAKAPLGALAFGAIGRITRDSEWALWGLALFGGIVTAVVIVLAGDSVYAGYDYVVGALTQSLAAASRVAGHDTSAQAELIDSAARLFRVLRWLLPGFFWLTAIAVVVCGWLGASWVRPSRTDAPLQATPIMRWRLSALALVALLTVVATRVIAWEFGQEQVTRICDNSLLVLGAAFTVAGLGVSEYVFRRLSAPWYIRAVYYASTFFAAHWGAALLATVGGLDASFDLRLRVDRALASADSD